MFSYERLLAVVESRFDHYSARAVLGEALRKAGLPADAKTVTADNLRLIAATIATVGKSEGLAAALTGLIDTPAAPAPATPAPKVEEAPAEAAPEATPEAAPEEAPAAEGEAEGEKKPDKKKKK